MRRLAALLLLVACQSAPPTPTEATPPPAAAAVPAPAEVTAIRRELTATVLGRPLGRIAIAREPLPGGGERWTSSTTMTLALDDPGESAKTIETTEVSEYGPGHVFLRSREDSTEDGVVESLTTEVVGADLVVVVRGPAHHSEKKVPLPEDFTSEMSVFERLRDEARDGATLPRSGTYSTFDDDRLAFERKTLRLIAPTKYEHDGRSIDAWEVESRDAEGERTVAILDDEGLPLRLEVGIFVAQLGEAPTPAADGAKLSSYLAVEGRVPARADALRVAVTVTGDDPADAPAFRDGPYQKVTRDGEVYTLQLAAVRGEGLAARGMPLSGVPDDVRQFLAPTAMSQSDDKDIVARAESIVAGVTDARAAAVRITRWVHENLGKRDGTRGAATAVETMTAGFGDCTEHAALTVAMLRAVGLPARNAGGLVLVPGIFSSDAGYHAWVEVWIGGWVALDPALGRMDVSAHYLLLGYSEPGMNSGSAALSRLIGRTRIAVLD